MKKFIKRLFGIVFGMILCCNNLCYADMISITPYDKLALGSMVLFPIGIILFLATIISYNVLKKIAKKEKSLGKIDEEETQKEIEKNKKYLFICISILTILISPIICLFNREYYPWILIIPITVLLIIAIVFRAKEKKKISYVLYAIAVAIFGIMCIQGNSVKNEVQERWKSVGRYSNLEIEEFNSKIIPYIGENIRGSQVNNLIQLASATNMKAIKNYDSIGRITIIR